MSAVPSPVNASQANASAGRFSGPWSPQRMAYYLVTSDYVLFYISSTFVLP